MEENKKRNNTQRNGKDYLFRIIRMQFILCTGMVLLLWAVCHFSGKTGEEIQKKWNSIMSVNIRPEEVISYIKEAAESVMKPVDVDSVKEVYIDEDDEEQEKDEETTEEEKPDTEEPDAERKTAEVMSMFSSDAEIISPIHGRISSHYGYRTDPISGEYALHSGLDIAVDEGTSVSAAWDGIVTESGRGIKRGNYVKMVHKNGCETLYCHCSDLLVKKGDVIRGGEIIALSGNTGYSTGPHLHFAIYKNGGTVDPLLYLSSSGGRI